MNAPVSTPLLRGVLTLAILVLGLTACDDVFFHEAAPAPVTLALSQALVDGAGGGTSPSQAFDQADVARVQVYAGLDTLVDAELPLMSRGGDKAIELELDLGEAAEASVSVRLFDGSAALFFGSTSFTVTPGVATEAVVPLTPILSGLVLAQGDTRIRALGDTLRFSANTVFANGTVMAEAVPATWNSSNTSVALAGPGGSVVGVGNGTATITATASGLSVGTSVVVEDRCLVSVPYVIGQTVTGQIERDDCLTTNGTNRVYDRYEFDLGSQTAIEFVYSVEGYEPFLVTGQGDRQIGGPNSAGPTVQSEHILPAGTYAIRTYARATAGNRDEAAVGSYTLTSSLIGEPQNGCGSDATVYFGVSATGSIDPSDCVDEFANDGIAHYVDGYVILLKEGESVTVTMTADSPYRFTRWVGEEYVEGHFGVPPGESRSLTASGSGFHYFYPISEISSGTVGSYTITFSGTPLSSASPDRSVSPLMLDDVREVLPR